ncbi:hypothetical protein ACQKC5_18445 [Shewanella baltica]|uniref:hypothetical protein n=1 Tax=Shewanella baltica TaxID=62322 RepID=UPI003D088F69
MGRRNSTFERLFEELFEFAGYFWQIGAVVTALLAFCSYKAAMWAHGLSSLPSTHITAAFEHFSWLFYLPSVMLGVITVLFFIKTLDAYQSNNEI